MVVRGSGVELRCQLFHLISIHILDGFQTEGDDQWLEMAYLLDPFSVLALALDIPLTGGDVELLKEVFWQEHIHTLTFIFDALTRMAGVFSEFLIPVLEPFTASVYRPVTVPTDRHEIIEDVV